ncbi:hypothetical protein [Streptomyces crystallinus]|uniref:XRE family transcriptional regulator n=1 Tax=Streptomyces crystallinus TaxID=68191 RepID=A0ABP3RU49_9ACTN
MMPTLFRYLLDEAGLRDYNDFLPHFRLAARELDEAGLRNLEPALKTFESWYYGKRQPQKDARRVLRRMFNLSIDELWSDVPAGSTPPPPTRLRTSTTDEPVDRGAVLAQMKRTADMAARRAAEFAMGTERGQLGLETLGLLTDEVGTIVERYQKVPLTEVWEDIARVQDEVFGHIEGGRARPSQLRELHVLATILSLHMAKGCHDMGDPKLAMMQARTAGVCAQHAEHAGLVALSFGVKSLVAYWANKGGQAFRYARQGTEECPDLRGSAAIWLRSLEARAAALLGDEESAREAIQHAESLRERVQPDDLDALGGILTFSEAKQLYYTVEAQTLLGLGSPDLAANAENAVRGFSDPGARDWAFGDQAGAQCNLALARLHGGDLDGAAEAIRPVLDLATPLRNHGIVASVTRVAGALGQSAARTGQVAGQLRQEIEAYEPNRLALPRP